MNENLIKIHRKSRKLDGKNTTVVPAVEQKNDNVNCKVAIGDD